MNKPLILAVLCGLGALIAFWLLLQTPGSLSDALSRPFQTLRGTQIQLNATLLEVSENAEPVRAAGSRLIKPWGVVHLIKVYDSPESDSAKKNR